MTSNSTPKVANGTQSPNPAKESAKASKSKSKQTKSAKEAAAAKAAEEEEEAAAYKEPELTPEEKHMRKEVSQLLLF